MPNWRGGWSKVEVDDNVSFTSPTEIPNLLSEGTGIEFETPTEALASGADAGAGKKVKVTVRSKDLTAATYTELIAAEQAVTKMFFRFTGLNPAQVAIVKDVIVVVEYDFKAAGAFNARKITGSGYSVTEAGVVAVTP